MSFHCQIIGYDFNWLYHLVVGMVFGSFCIFAIVFSPFQSNFFLSASASHFAPLSAHASEQLQSYWIWSL